MKVMHVIGSFEYSPQLELAIKKLEEKGIQRQHIVAIPLDEREEKIKLFDTIHRADGVSLLDLAFILGTIFMLLGAIYGFVLEWGPIIWGFIGLISGLVIGSVIKYLSIRDTAQKKRSKKKTTEVFLTIQCNDDQFEIVKKTLFEHYALAIGYLKNS